MPNYTFIPWLRRGAVRLATSPEEKERLAVPLHLKVAGEGEPPIVIDRNARLYGPGDVSGLDWRSIVRTTPRSGVRDFEANFLAAIEFYDEDFLWRYTPALPDPATGKLKPWVWLTVLEETEYQRIKTLSGQLPAIEIFPRAIQDAFPHPDTIASWAHVHLDFTPQGSDHAAWLANVNQQLGENPNLGCTRLLCPRRLKPKTRYRAFLLPAFEKGRLAGLGRPETEIADTPNAQPAWPVIEESGNRGIESIPPTPRLRRAEPIESIESIPFPVYYEWEFATASAGDFEDLARKLTPISLDELTALAGAAQLLDVSEPGWGINDIAGALRLESALKLPIPLAPVSGEETRKTQLRKKLAPLLNLGVQPLDNLTGNNHTHPYFEAENNPAGPATLEDDPIVVPPLYGSFYRQGETVPAAASSDWFQHTNLNPVYRISAAQGTAVVQKNQETYMDRAWDQWRVYAEIQPVSRRWEFSLQVSQTLFAKRFDPLFAGNNQPETSYGAVGFFAPMHASIALRDQNNQVNSLVSNLGATRWSSTHSPAFAKLTRPGGSLMRRFQEKPQGLSFFKANVIFASNPVNPLKKAVDTIVSHLAKNGDLGPYLQNKGFGGLEPSKIAFSAWQPYLTPRFNAPLPAPDTLLLLNAIRAEALPGKAIAKRFETLVESVYPGVSNPATPPQDAPVFPEPMYQELAARSSDFILPGLDRILPNRVAILEPNAAFIEAYLIGLNHEIAREFLWREFPAPLNATCFRQFWDVRNAAAGGPDILPIRHWGKNTPLGAHRPPPPVNPLVVVIRGDLLRKYPNAEIFMVRADWKKKKAGTHQLSLDPAQPEQWAPTSPLLLRPVFSARLEPDYQFLGFPLSPQQARGTSDDPGWFFVLRERAGEVNFGLDITAETSVDPSWEALEEVAENQCIDVESARFAGLPRSGTRADQVAAMLYQKPFMLFIHASRLLPET